MPIRFYECSNGHITEQVEVTKTPGKTIYTLPEILASRQQKQPRTYTCSTCSELANEVLLSHSETRMARNFSPTLLYKHPDGRVVMPGRNDPRHLPKKYKDKLAKQGYVETTISNFREYQTFVKEQRSLLESQQSAYIREQQAEYDKAVREQIAAFKRGDSLEIPITDERGRVVGSRTIKQRLDDLSPKMRELAELGIERALNHRIQGGSINPHIHSMEFDNTSYRDEDTSWKKRR